MADSRTEQVLCVRTDSDLTIGDGNFGVRVVAGEALYVPETLAKLLEAIDMATADGLVTAVRSFPALFSDKFSWLPGQTRAALDNLVETLQGLGEVDCLAQPADPE